MSDFRYALRTLTARPGFSAVAILTLALGIGANAAIFTVVNAVLLRQLPFPDPDRLVLVMEHTAQFPTLTASWQNYVDWREQARSFEAFGAFRPLTMTLGGGTDPERVPAKMVSASLLPALGVEPQIGRAFGADDDRAGAAGVVLLSDALWHRRFGGTPDAVGRSITLDNEPYTVIGVLKPQFQLMQPADVLLPLGPWAATLPDDRTWHPGIWPLARLKPTASVQQARTEMDVISERLAREYPAFNHAVTAQVVRLRDFMVHNIRQSLLVLVAAVGFVLLIACANVANLLLARAVGRQKEIAIRTALGASRTRIAGQLLVESVLLAIGGGAAGLLLAVWSIPLLAQLTGSNATAAGAIRIDSTALAFTFLVSIATELVFGLVPALHTTRVDVMAAVNDAGRGASAGAGHHRLRSTLVVVEMALATVLLVGAVLLTKSLARLQDVAPGFDPKGILVADVPLSPVTYATAAARNRFLENLRPRLLQIPGVTAADVVTQPPFSGSGATIHFNIIGRPPKGPEEFVTAGFRAIGPDYFDVLAVPVLAGRRFTGRDRDSSQPVAIVNQTFVRQFFDGDVKRALGARAQLGALPDDGPDSPVMNIVGVVGDTRQAFEAATQPTIFVPYLQYPIEVISGLYRAVTIALKAEADPAALAGALTAAVRNVDREQPVARVRTMEEAMSESVAQPRLRTTLLMTFSSVALLLALVGVYGVMAYAVGERAHEIGVRIALGAAPREIESLVVGEGARLAAVGIAIGLVCALAASRALTSLLFGISATDPETFVLSAIGLSAAGVAAAYGPARRASRIDPVVLLR